MSIRHAATTGMAIALTLAAGCRLAGTNPSSARSTTTVHANEKIARDDRLKFTITECNPEWDFAARCRVDANGQIEPPYLEPIGLAGLTITQAEEELLTIYRRAFEDEIAKVTIKSGPVQVGDNILFQIMDLDGLGVQTSKVFVVDSNGTITPPLVNSVKIAALTEYESEGALAAAYRDAQIVTNPQIRIERISEMEANGIKAKELRTK